MTAEQIKILLSEKYSGEEWAFFGELRTLRGYSGGVESYVDAVAIGLWSKNKKCIAYEIKISRQDFTKDADNFILKHKNILKACHEFYYICPHGLISPDEVPARAGLMYVNSNNTLIKKKQAPFQDIDSYDFRFIQALAFRFCPKISPAEIPLKFLGKEISQEDFNKLVEKKVIKEKNRYYDLSVRGAAHDLVFKENEKIKQFNDFLGESARIIGLGSWHISQSNYNNILKYIKIGAAIVDLKCSFTRVKQKLGEAEVLVKNLTDITVQTDDPQ